MRDEFDPDELHRLVDEALEERQSVAPPATSKGRIPFAFNDTRLFEKLADLLPKYLHQADAQVVMNELRDELYDGIDQGDLRQMHSVIKYCRRCPDVEPNPQQPTWNLVDPDVVFVTDGPNRSAKADEYFVAALKRAGFSSARIALTGATRCRTKEARSPNTEELNNCSGYLYSELGLLSPSLIVPMGNSASSKLVGSIKITEDHGKIFWVGPWAILPTFPVSYVLRSDLQDQFEQDLAKAYSFVYGEKL